MPRSRIPMRPAYALLGPLALLCLAACAPTSTVSVTPTPTATATTQPAPMATPVPDWQVFTDPKFGFKIDVPGVLWIDPNQPQVQTATEASTIFVYRFTRTTPSSPMASLFALTGGLQVYASTAPARCLLQGTPVPVGQGQRITGYRYDTFNPPPSSGATALGGGVAFVAGGLYVTLFIGANNQVSSSAYWTAYGAVWQHILASFVPAPSNPTGHPCG